MTNSDASFKSKVQWPSKHMLNYDYLDTVDKKKSASHLKMLSKHFSQGKREG